LTLLFLKHDVGSFGKPFQILQYFVALLRYKTEHYNEVSVFTAVDKV